MYRVWDTSKYPPKPFVTLRQVKVIQGHQVKKAKYKILGFVCCDIYIFWSDFRQERKYDPLTSFERPKSDEI